MHHLKDTGAANPKRLLYGLQQNLKVVVWNLQQFSTGVPSRKPSAVVGTVKRLERASKMLTRLVNSPSFITTFANELVKRPFGTVEARAYIEDQKSMIGDLKKALEDQGSCQTEKIRQLLQVVEAVAQQGLPRGRSKNPNFDILDQIIILEAVEYGNSTGKHPTIFIDEKTGLPGPFLKQVLDAIAAKNLDFSYEQIQYRKKLLSVHPVHGAFFN